MISLTSLNEDGFSYDHWMDLLTNAIDHTLVESRIDLNYGDNRLLRNKQLDHASAEWERIKFFEQHEPNVDDLVKTIDYFVAELPQFEFGKRREFRLALEHEQNVKEWLGNTKFREADRQYILDRELHLAEEFFTSDDKYDIYSELDYRGYTQVRLRQLFDRFRNDYPEFYQCYELDHNNQKNNHLTILQQNSVANLATKLKW
ncbi:hypothetical protein Lcor42L_03515 [Loigolactobacillus coryniformis subsp. torquens]|nr:hypothetical protein [Loigolactobacillus coryniformis subsp. torquens]MBW4804537.1 hypothetical protein [Loigolactobacillus coryniformis subsp. torquens]